MCGICVSIFHVKDEDTCKQQILPDISFDKLLTNRGPDIQGRTGKQVGFNHSKQSQPTAGGTLQLNCHGCVLHLRGEPTKQPLEDEHGNLLLWNGEVFGGNLEVLNSENDGKKLLSRLSEIALKQSQENFEKDLIETLQGIHGPWAFIYWQNSYKQLWFGRDFFGRRSLLWHFPSSKSDGFMLSSVATRSKDKMWYEIPAAKIYKLSAEDLLRFYDPAKNNDTKFEEYVQSTYLVLPRSDYNIFNQEIHYLKKNNNFTDDIKNTCCGKTDSSSMLGEASCNFENIESKGVDRSDSQQCRTQNSSTDISLCTSGGGITKKTASATNLNPSLRNFEDETDNSHCFSGTSELLDKLSKLCLEYAETLESQSNNPDKDISSIEGLRDSYSENSNSKSRLDSLSVDETNPPITDNYLQHVILPKLRPSPPGSESNINQILLEFYVGKFLRVMEEATRRRVYNLPRSCTILRDERVALSHAIAEECSERNSKISRVGILFSGGIDCMVLAALADRVLPEDEPIDLLNVAFAQQDNSVFTNRKKGNSQVEKKKDPYAVPDRLTGRSGVKELNPRRTWNFIEINVTLEEVKAAREERIQHLLHPLETVLDDSIGCAIWFAARGRGSKFQLINQELEKISDDYCSPVKVVLTGMGADEQLGGYARHRSKFEKFAWDGLESEIKMETERISSRNLGRDDRCISDHGREARFPYLDENVVSFLNSVPIWIKCDPRLPRGHGEKRLLRQMATRLNLTGSVSLPKRAIQFGSRIAKLENSKEKGSDSCNRLTFDKET